MDVQLDGRVLIDTGAARGLGRVTAVGVDGLMSGRDAAFLLSPAASIVTGVRRPIDGGMRRAL